MATARGKVVTTTDKEIVGAIHVPIEFRLELDFGALDLETDKLRSITFTDDRPTDKPVGTGAPRRDFQRPRPSRAGHRSEPAPLFSARQRHYRHLARGGPSDALQLRDNEVRVDRAVGVK